MGGGVGLGGGGVRVDVDEELKFWGKFTKKRNLGGGGGVGRGVSPKKIRGVEGFAKKFRGGDREGWSGGGVGLVGGSGWM